MYTEQSIASGCSRVDTCSESLSLPVPSVGESLSFSLKFPESTLQGDKTIPSTTTMYFPGVKCEVSYRLKVTLVKKGLRRNERCEAVEHSTSNSLTSDLA